MASVTTISRPVRYPPYPVPWCHEAVLDAVPFFQFQKLMKEQMNICHGIRREHYGTFLAAMCGKPSQTCLDKVTHIRWYLLFEFTSLLQSTPEIDEKSEALAYQLLSAEQTHQQLRQKMRQSSRSRPRAICSAGQSRAICSAGRSRAICSAHHTKNRFGTCRKKLTKKHLRVNYSTEENKQVHFN